MIKRVRFVTRSSGVAAASFAAGWPRAVAAAASAPPAVRPLRVTACVALPELSGPAVRHDGVSSEWFADDAHLDLFEAWSASPDAAPRLEQLTLLTFARSHASSPAPASSPDSAPTPTPPFAPSPSSTADNSKTLVVTESVLRGESWLDQRWRDCGDKLVHMAVAVRGPGLTAGEFSQRWRDHAGQVRQAGAARATVIPDQARGRAYVQNHPVREGPYDALSEIYFDDVEGLRTRIDWFAGNAPNPADGELFGQSWFIAAREIVLA